MRRDDLAYVRRDDLESFLDRATELLCREFGFQLAGKTKGNGADHDDGPHDRADWAALIGNIVAGRDLHDSTVRLAGAYITSGMDERGATRAIEALFLTSDTPRDERWKARFDDVGRAVRTGYAKYGKETNANAAPASNGLAWDRMDAMQSEAVNWVWPGYLARGKLTLLAGDPGVGKSQISLDVAARITCGSAWPDGSFAPRGSVLLLTAEDSAKDTVRPRLEALGADLARVHRLRSVTIAGKVDTFSLQRDLDALGEKVTELGDVIAVVIDPITSYLGAELDSHRTSSVRAVLEPLADWADIHKVAVLGITHPPKAAQAKALHAITGSLAFVAAARLVFIAIEETGTERRLLLPVKNNLGALAPGLGYRLAQTIVGAGIVTTYVAYDSAPVTITANEAVRAQPDDKPALREAVDFLREELPEGPKAASAIKRAAAGAGLSWATVRRAQEELHIRPKKTDLKEGWQWELPAEGAHEGAQGAHYSY